ncbi:MAG TPA: RdgB/HAM1 family non-canonical purine NTP pyrophosphatase [Bacilli bacterium]|nr:MAG: Non-canonical purine NTP pyrophosphatase [Tenericutes bacterium ADurb.BinA124]HNZ50655.1 RdgB/HAM1 family non-canonical purine NTP pyrophosphatase [Bacilli bacterium]HOH18458.1 RdgB/HAM1 family non-canonical purine NTP pyrophosphatase [Bacilli bacterium]HPN60935.1 RdgB/HAM1 family non-canonical purine NTP pyrophosphatase [Bacilli bacterium]HPX84676.1 RdgB/HAM1 family non-canonical purine NTP pyrophosphatase [Bacilli bacterium]
MKILFASHNLHKLKEIQSLLPSFELLSLKELHDNDDVEEDGNTFAANAFKKAHYYFQKYHLPVFADDSGLIVSALNGEPGVKSARYSGLDADYHRNNLLLLKNMEGIKERTAFFVTVICFIEESGQVHFFEGKWKGIIHEQLQGDNGFGYDPLFYLPELDKTAAELTIMEKNQFSHRALAFQQFSRFLKKHYPCF